MMNGISVILCCYNSSERLTATLQHLAAQTTPNDLDWEIVLVDNASTDNTAAMARQNWDATCSQVPLRIVNEPRQGLSFARMTGHRHAQYDILLFCDDDNWLAPDYLSVVHAIFRQHPEAGAAGGTGEAVTTTPLPPWFEQYKGCYACYPQAAHEGVLTGEYAFLYGAGLAVRRSVVEELLERGYEPLLPDRVGDSLVSGGDTELSYAIRLIGYSLWFSASLKFKHFLPARRLTENYLVRLVASMSYCSGLLLMYHYVLSDKKVSPLTWPKDAIYQLYFFGRAFFRKLTKKNDLAAKLDYTFSLNRMKSVWNQVGSYNATYRQIARLKARNHEA